MDLWDGKFVDEVLSDEGNAFAVVYYGPAGEMGQYIDDYEETLSKGEPTLYHIEDSWTNYDKLAPVIDRRFSEWKDGKMTSFGSEDFDRDGIVVKPWWKFW